MGSPQTKYTHSGEERNSRRIPSRGQANRFPCSEGDATGLRQGQERVRPSSHPPDPSALSPLSRIVVCYAVPQVAPQMQGAYMLEGRTMIGTTSRAVLSALVALTVAVGAARAGANPALDGARARPVAQDKQVRQGGPASHRGSTADTFRFAVTADMRIYAGPGERQLPRGLRSRRRWTDHGDGRIARRPGLGRYLPGRRWPAAPCDACAAVSSMSARPDSQRLLPSLP